MKTTVLIVASLLALSCSTQSPDALKASSSIAEDIKNHALPHFVPAEPTDPAIVVEMKQPNSGGMARLKIDDTQHRVWVTLDRGAYKFSEPDGVLGSGFSFDPKEITEDPSTWRRIEVLVKREPGSKRVGEGKLDLRTGHGTYTTDAPARIEFNENGVKK